MPRLLAFATLLAAAACAGAVQPDANKGAALVVPSGAGASKPRGGAAGVTASLDARADLSLTFNAAALDREAQVGLSASAVAVDDDDATALKRATDVPASELPLPKVRCAKGRLRPSQAQSRDIHLAGCGCGGLRARHGGALGPRRDGDAVPDRRPGGNAAGDIRHGVPCSLRRRRDHCCIPRRRRLSHLRRHRAAPLVGSSRKLRSCQIVYAYQQAVSAASMNLL